MERNKVESTSIKSVGYDPKTKSLEVEVAAGRVYRYDEVPEHVYESFMSAKSKGRFFNTTIKNEYSYTKEQQGSDGS